MLFSKNIANTYQSSYNDNSWNTFYTLINSISMFTHIIDKTFCLKIDNQCLLPYLPLTTCICNKPIYGLLSRTHALRYLLKDNKTLSDYYSLQYKRSIKWSIKLLKLIVIFHFNIALLLKINTIMIEWENHTIMLGFFLCFLFFLISYLSIQTLIRFSLSIYLLRSSDPSTTNLDTNVKHVSLNTHISTCS